MQKELKYTKIFDNCLAVFQGGGCKAIAYIGAYKAARDRGVQFTELAGTSAGAIIAALIAAGASPEDLNRFIKGIDFKQFTKKSKTDICISCMLVGIFFPIILLVSLSLRVNPKYPIRILMQPLRNLIKYNVLYSLDKLEEIISVELKTLTKKIGDEDVTFKDLTPNLHIVSSDIVAKKEKVWNKDLSPDYSVAKAVCASCAYPFFFRPIEDMYVDGGLLSNSPNHLFVMHPHYNKILSFQLETNSENVSKPLAFIDYIMQMVSTVVDGAVSVQSSMGAKVYPIIIKLKDITALDFDKLTPDKIEKLINSGENTCRDFFANEEKPEDLIESNPFNRRLCSYEHIYSWVATQSKAVIQVFPRAQQEMPTDKILERVKIKDSNPEDKYSNRPASPLGTKGINKDEQDTNITQKVYVSTNDTKWVWSLLPTVIRWVTNKTKVVVFLPKNVEHLDSCEKSRRRLLKSLGCSVQTEGIDVNGFFLMSNSRWKGVIYEDIATTEQPCAIDGCHYDLKLDSVAIEAWIAKINQKKDKEKQCRDLPIILRHLSIEKIRRVLHMNSEMYKNAKISQEIVQVNDLLFLSHHVRLEKYRQIEYLADLYNQFKLQIFEPAEMDVLDGQKVIVSPVIVERRDDKLYVIEGNTRVKYAAVNGYREITVIIVEGVKTELPVVENYNFSNVWQLVITDNKQPDNMSCKDRFRHIEEWLHPSDKFLVSNYY